MITFSQLEKYDKLGMHKIYDIWPKIAKDSFESAFEPVDFKNIDHIVFAGMGGSGSLGDIFEAVFSKTQIHISVVKGYLLPKTVDENTLVIASSVSGNTIETLTVLESAKKTKCHLISFSSGGKLYEQSKKDHILSFSLPFIHSPRSAFPVFLYTMLNVLAPLIPLSKQEIKESVFQIENLQKSISYHNLSDTNTSLDLSEWITGIPIIYYPAGFKAVAIRFKNSLQENSKLHCMTEDIIESCHNGIVAWENKSTIQPILIQGPDDYIKTKERWSIIKEYFQKNNIDYYEILSPEGNILTKLTSLIYLLDYASIYHAIKSKTDPSPTNSINYIKSRIT
jgi:glucose/mannose-6-phosphate isomerase